MTSALSDSLWFNTCQENFSASELIGDVDVDLVVIGGGFTGLSAALRARIEGASVCLIEANHFGHGGSGRNVGLVNAGLWLPPERINAQLGETAGKHLSRVLASAPNLVFQLIERHGIACEPVRNGTLHCAHAPKGMIELTDRHRQMKQQGAPVQLITRDEAVARVGTDSVHGALFDPRAGTIQPLAYAKGLARAARDAGAQLYETTPATSVNKTGQDWHVTTPKGRVVAKRLILTTNGYSQHIDGLKSPETIPIHYFQAATDPLSAEQIKSILPGTEGCWDTALIMSSWRLDQAGRLIIGAMGDLGHALSKVHTNWLPRKLAALYPALSGIGFSQTWFGRIAMTTEHLPKILALDPSALIAFGYSGRGIGPGTLFGQQMASALLGGTFSDLPVAPVTEHALPFAGVRQAYCESGATLVHLIKDRF